MTNKDLEDWLETQRPGFKEWARSVRAEYANDPGNFDPHKAIVYTEDITGNPLAHESTVMLNVHHIEQYSSLGMRPEDV